MRAKDLIKILQTDPERLIVLSRDEEGNGYGTLTQIDTMKYKDGEVGLEFLTEELKRQGYSYEDIMRVGGEKAFVLYP